MEKILDLKRFKIKELSKEELKAKNGGFNDRPYGQPDYIQSDSGEGGGGHVAPRTGIITACAQILWEKIFD